MDATYTLCMGNHKCFADELQALLIQRGYRCNIRTQRQRTSWHAGEPKPQYVLHVRRQTKATIGGTVQRPTGIVRPGPNSSRCHSTRPRKCGVSRRSMEPWVTRRNGKVAIIGNCGRGGLGSIPARGLPGVGLGGNILRHGPVDALQIKEPGTGAGKAPAKECPECQAVIHAAYATCPECGHEFPTASGRNTTTRPQRRAS